MIPVNNPDFLFRRLFNSFLLGSGLLFLSVVFASDIFAAENSTANIPRTSSPQTFEKPTLSQLLAGMGAALNSGNFTMSMVYIHDNQIDTLRFSHLSTSTDRFDKLEHLQGTQRMVISRNGDTYLVMGKEQIHLANDEGSPVSRWRSQLEKLAKNIHHYDISISGLNRIAGRPTFELDFSAIQNDRYSTRLWLDAITNLPLRIDTLDKNNRIIEQILAIDLQYPANLSEVNFLIDKNLNQLTQDIQSSMPDKSSSSWKIGWLPAGYEMSVYHLNKLAEGFQSEQWVYSDGLTSLSVFVENKKATKSKDKHMQHNNRAFIRGDTLIFDTHRDNIRITVVGDIPFKIAEKIAQSVTAKAPAPVANDSLKENLSTKKLSKK